MRAERAWGQPTLPRITKLSHLGNNFDDNDNDCIISNDGISILVFRFIEFNCIHSGGAAHLNGVL